MVTIVPPDQRDLDAMRGIRIPSDISCIYADSAVYGIRHHDAFARSRDVVDLCTTSADKKFARARNARLIMSNEVPKMATDDVKPYCIWYPDVASEETYRSLARQYPDMIYSVGRACAVAGYSKLYHELNILPEVSIAEEARDNAASSGSRAIFDHIMSQPVCYAILDDYTRTANITTPRSPAFMNGDAAVRSLLDVRIGGDEYAKSHAHYFDIVEDGYVAETSSKLNHSDSQALDDPEHVDMMYTPLLSHLPAVTKDPLILMAAYEGNLDRYIRLRRPKLLRQEEKAIIRGIYHNTTFAKYWSVQDLGRYQRGREIRRATIARFIMVNDLSHITPDTPAGRDMPGMIWWPLLPDQVTLRELARRRPDTKLQVAMACIAANYERLWQELKPEPTPELWKLARRQFVTSSSAHPVRSYFTDYMETREAENRERTVDGGGREHISARAPSRHYRYRDHTNGLCDNAAVLDKEPTSTLVRPRIDLPMTSEAQHSVYSNCSQANAADWELFICSTDEQRQQARDSGGFYLFYEQQDCPSEQEPGHQTQKGENCEP